MARIAGVDLPKNKRVEIGLTYIYGIGRNTAATILKETGVNPDTRVKDLTESDVALLRDYIDKHYTVEGDLRREVALNIKWKSAATVAVVTVRVCRFAVSAQRPTQEPGRVRLRPSLTRRSKGGNELWHSKRVRRSLP